MTFADKACRFFTSVELKHELPPGIEVMNPYKERSVRDCFRAFLKKYFDDTRKRVLIFGINPGRFGAGLTGVAFTDPVALQDFCGIPNDQQKIREPSSVFVYQVIDAMGGPKKFFRDFFLTTTCPLGFTVRTPKTLKNYNFYDDTNLERDVTPLIVRSIRAQLAFGTRTDVAVVLGNGTLMKYLERLNAEHGFFKKLIPLEHPRFIIQYRRKRIGEYVEKYVRVLRATRDEKRR
jgi:hypothetical protein